MVKMMKPTWQRRCGRHGEDDEPDMVKKILPAADIIRMCADKGETYEQILEQACIKACTLYSR
jgi:hypothetical protein